VKHLLVVAPNWLGDGVMALPAIADLRRALPEAVVSVLARPSVAPLFSIEKGVGRVFLTLDHARGDKTAPDPVFDAAILLPNSFHSALMTLRAGIPERWGYRTDWRRALLTRAIEPPAGAHQVDYYQQLVRAVGFATGPSVPHLDVPADVRQTAATLLRDRGWDRRTIVALAPGAAFGPAKQWPPNHFAELASALAADGVHIVLVGAKSDARTAAAVVTLMAKTPAASRTAVINLVGQTDIPTLAGVLSHARAVVANDSGAMHLAAAIGVPVTAIFGPTNERLTSPRGHHEIVTHPVWCRPCMLRECPLDHACMRGVTVAAVLDLTRRRL